MKTELTKKEQVQLTIMRKASEARMVAFEAAKEIIPGLTEFQFKAMTRELDDYKYLIEFSRKLERSGMGGAGRQRMTQRQTDIKRETRQHKARGSRYSPIVRRQDR